MYAHDGSLSISILRHKPDDARGHAIWLPAPEENFVWSCGSTIPSQQVLDGTPHSVEGERNSQDLWIGVPRSSSRPPCC